MNAIRIIFRCGHIWRVLSPGYKLTDKRRVRLEASRCPSCCDEDGERFEGHDGEDE